MAMEQVEFVLSVKRRPVSKNINQHTMRITPKCKQTRTSVLLSLQGNLYTKRQVHSALEQRMRSHEIAIESGASEQRIVADRRSPNYAARTFHSYT